MTNDNGAGSTMFGNLITSVVVTDANDRLTSSNAAAERTLLGSDSIGRRLEDKLAEAARFGRISIVGVSQFNGAIAAGSGAFHTGDGRTFVLHSFYREEFRHLEWTDVSGFVSQAATRDPITGLPSRQGFVNAQKSSRGAKKNGVVIRLSLDTFNDVHDQLGQAIADHLLRRTADRIANRIDAARVDLAHAGNGEFVFIAEKDEERAVSADLREVLARPYLVDGKMINCTVSIGTAPHVDGDAIESDLRNAGLALQKARSEGGNRNRGFTTDMREAIERKKTLEVDLRKALALREFFLVYQPQYRVERRELVGFEALLRWNRDAGPVSPGEFVPLAEELGLISPIGEWVLRTACRQAAAWPEHISVSVNVSPLQFRAPGFVSTVNSTLETTGLDPGRLDLEITEGAFLMNSAPIMDIFQQMKALGVRFSMDDFGTGFSSLSYLQRFPFDKIKIDQSFVRNLPDKDSGAIIRAVCALGNTLGMTTIAEGVETEAQLSEIKKIGCHQVQGYLTGRPLAPDAADRLAADA